MTFGERLKELRTETKITKKALAAKMGIASRTISQYENHGVFPSSDIAIKLAEHFEVSLDYLCGLSDFRELNSPDYSLLENYYVLLTPERRQDALMYMDFLKSGFNNSKQVEKVLTRNS